MYKRLILIPLFLLIVVSTPAQTSFSRGNSTYRSYPHFSGVAGGFIDIDGDFVDDLVVLDKGRVLELGINYGKDKKLNWQSKLPINLTPEYSIVAIDIDNDGIKEMIAGGAYSGSKIIKYVNNKLVLSEKNLDLIYTQASNVIDINNDGFLDYFACNDDGDNLILMNDGKGKLIKKDLINYNTLPPSDNSGNYGSEWADVDLDGDLDLYIAKCRFGVDNIEDPRRHNMLFINNNGVFKNEADERGLKDKGQSWTGSFADYDNDGDLDCIVTNHDTKHVLYKNDGRGYYSKSDAKIELDKSFAFQSLWQDIDNNGFLDLIIVGADVTEIHYNQDGKTFLKSPKPFSTINTNSITAGDINNDGFIDFAAYFGKEINQPSTLQDELFINNRTNNNYIKVSLRGIKSNRQGIGAKLIAYGAWGKQLREVHSGVSYGVSNSLNQIIGLGANSKMDSLVIIWPSGIKDTYSNLSTNQWLIANEGACLKAVEKIKLSKDVLCKDEKITLEVNNTIGNLIKWNNGLIGNKIEVNKAGKYHAQITDTTGCMIITEIISIDSVSNQKILDESSDTLYFCGKATLLGNSKFKNFRWSNGDTLTVSTYIKDEKISVSADNMCNEKVTETKILRKINPTINLKNDTIKLGETAILKTKGEDIKWYDENNNFIKAGDSIAIENIKTNTSFYATNTKYEGIKNYSIGEKDIPTFGNLYSADAIDAGFFLQVFNPTTILTTDVSSDTEGTRRIIITNEEEDTIYQKDFYVLKSAKQTLTLNAKLPPGNNYRMKTDTSINRKNLGIKGPRLVRIQESKNFPFEVKNLIEFSSATNNSAGYYYFFNMKVADEGISCTTQKTKVDVIIDLVNTKNQKLNKTIIFPNPTQDDLTIYTEMNDQFIICNMSGNEFIKGKLSQGTNKIDLSSLVNGLYILKTKSTNEFHKILIQK